MRFVTHVGCERRGGGSISPDPPRVRSKPPADRHRRLPDPCTVSEETADPGAASFLSAGLGGDAGFGAESTSLRVAVAQRGRLLVGDASAMADPSNMRLWAAARVPVTRLNITPTTVGGPAVSTAQAGRRSIYID